MLVTVAAHILNLNIRVFQEEKATGYINITQHIYNKTDKTINLKFTHSVKSVENHYDSICKLTPTPYLAMGDISQDMNSPLDLTGFVSKHSPQPVDLTISPTKNNLSDYTVDLTFSPPPPSPENLTSDLEDLTYENIPTDEEDDRYLKKMRQGVTFPFHFLEHIKEEEVTLLPPEIDGSKKYRLKATISNFTDLVKDRRWFRLSKSTVSDPKTVRRVGRCGGSFVCNNLNCSFVSTQGEKNTSKFIFSSGVRVCHSCGHCVTLTPCFARKLIKFREEEGYVYVAHLGKHTCTPKLDRKKYDNLIRKKIERNTTLPPKKLKLKLIKEKVGEQKFTEAKEVAAIFSDTRRVKSIRREILIAADALPPNSMEAVAKVKSGSDEHDNMHIYKINSKSMNPDYPVFVFKTSQVMMEIALQMDQAGEENALQDEMCFFDGAHSRVTGFVALAAWVLHPSIRLLFRLASMEVLSESSTTVRIFWDLFNERLQKVRAKLGNEKEVDSSYKFNRKGFMCDESGTNFKGIEAAFGRETVIHKVKTCQWHFKHQAREKAKLTESFEEEVLKLCDEMCLATTVDEYERKLNRLLEIGDMYPAFLPFVHWWDARRYHVFKVFRHFNLPGVNCAEIGNAAWKRDGKISSIVEAANDDIATMLVKEVEYANFKRKDTPPPVAAGPTDKKKTCQVLQDTNGSC